MSEFRLKTTSPREFEAHFNHRSAADVCRLPTLTLPDPSKSITMIAEVCASPLQGQNLSPRSAFGILTRMGNWETRCTAPPTLTPKVGMESTWPTHAAAKAKAAAKTRGRAEWRFAVPAPDLMRGT
jgi:hypothetical protein